ncbi:MAG: hypothetical protein Rubg2KO_12290 [Rubricoccaceae bacterium]
MDEGLHASSLRREDGHVGLNNSALTQRFEPSPNGRRRQADGLAELIVRAPVVRLDELEEGAVESVEGHGAESERETKLRAGIRQLDSANR